MSSLSSVPVLLGHPLGSCRGSWDGRGRAGMCEKSVNQFPGLSGDRGQRKRLTFSKCPAHSNNNKKPSQAAAAIFAVLPKAGKAFAQVAGDIFLVVSELDFFQADFSA